MSIDCQQLRVLIIRPTLQKLNLWSQSAENLLLGTCAQESQMGSYVAQVNGPALGIYQIEPNTYQDVLNNFLRYKPALNNTVASLAETSIRSLMVNLDYATAITRIIYLRAPEPLPDADDLNGLAHYYKEHYNTPLGAATVDQFIANYKRYVIT